MKVYTGGQSMKALEYKYKKREDGKWIVFKGKVIDSVWTRPIDAFRRCLVLNGVKESNHYERG